MLIPSLSRSSMSSPPLSTITFRERSTDPKIEVAHSISWTWGARSHPSCDDRVGVSNDQPHQK